MFAFVVGIVSQAFEEVLIGPVQVHELLLEYLTVGFIEPGVSGMALEFDQECRRLGVGQPLASLLIMVPAGGQKVVVDKAGVAELDCQPLLLLGGGVNSILEAFLHPHGRIIVQMF